MLQGGVQEENTRRDSTFESQCGRYQVKGGMRGGGREVWGLAPDQKANSLWKRSVTIMPCRRKKNRGKSNKLRNAESELEALKGPNSQVQGP